MGRSAKFTLAERRARLQKLCSFILENGSNIFETEIANKLESYKEKIPKEYITKIIYTEEETDEVNEIQQNINSYKNDMITRFIIGDLDVDAKWDSYIKELKSIGVERLVSTAQKAYERTNK